MAGRGSFAPSGIVTLTSDFGTRDAYVGAMKGVLLSRAPELSLHDVSHEIEPQNVRHGAAVLRAACPYFPRGTVHLAVVDPGVGTERAAIVILAGGHALVGPDNGLLDPVARALGGIDDARRIDSRGALAAILAPSPAPTFHGRDIFAPVAASLASGRITPSDVGDRHEPRALEPLPVTRTASSLEGQVMWCDRFGNAITNIAADDLASLPTGDRSAVLPDGSALALARTYGDVSPGNPLALIGSDGFLEIAVRDGSASQTLGLSAGATIRVQLANPRSPPRVSG